MQSRRRLCHEGLHQKLKSPTIGRSLGTPQPHPTIFGQDLFDGEALVFFKK